MKIERVKIDGAEEDDGLHGQNIRSHTTIYAKKRKEMDRKTRNDGIEMGSHINRTNRTPRAPIIFWWKCGSQEIQSDDYCIYICVRKKQEKESGGGRNGVL